MKGKNLQPRILYPARLSFRVDREIKSFTDKKKLKRIQQHQTNITRNAKGNSVNGKDKALTRNKKIITGKGKHTEKIGNHPYINVISKPAIMRREYKCRLLGALEIKRPAT